ncbi:MAG: hypothetical protein MZU97_08145 [Bacillus subtilis]|nr:hypothetical protein [Bacillus subtilis]
MEDGPDRVLRGRRRRRPVREGLLRKPGVPPVLLPGPPGKPHRWRTRRAPYWRQSPTTSGGTPRSPGSPDTTRRARDPVHGQAHGRDGALLLQCPVLRPREQAVPDGGPDPAGDELVHLLRERSGEFHGSRWDAAGSRY